MAKSRRTEKQQLLKDYEALLQEERAEEKCLQREEDEFWAQKIEYERYLHEQEMEERQLCNIEDYKDDAYLYHCSEYDFYPNSDPLYGGL